MTEENKIKNNDIIDTMFKAGAHFGYQKSRRDASTTPFIFGTKNKVEIIDLEKTVEQLEKAKEFVSSLAKTGKQILFVGGKSEAKTAIKIGAMSIDMPYVDGRWIGGAITNFSEIKKRMFSGIVSMKDAPKALFVIDPKKEFIAVAEAKKAGISVIALANTDCNIKLVDFPIVANDASVSSIEFFVSEIVKSYKAGKVSKA